MRRAVAQSDVVRNPQPYTPNISSRSPTEAGSINFTVKIFSTSLGQCIEPSRWTLQHSIRSKETATNTHIIVVPFQFDCQRLRSSCTRFVQNFQYLVINWIHPIRSLATHYGLNNPYILHRLVGALENYMFNSVKNMLNIFYYMLSIDLCRIGRLSRDTEAIRGSNSLLGPVRKCGPVLGHWVRGSSRNHTTEAMCKNDTRGLEHSDKPAESTTNTECPRCGRTVAAVETRGPATHILTPCGHSVGSLTISDYIGGVSA